MVKRTTIEIDQVLLKRAQRVLGESTTRGTVEHALRLAADAGEADGHARAERQRHYLAEIARRLDLKVLASDDMWR